MYLQLLISSCIFHCLSQVYVTNACFNQLPDGSTRVVWGYKGNVFGAMAGGTLILVHSTVDLVESGTVVVLSRPDQVNYTCTKSVNTPQRNNSIAFLTPKGNVSDIGQEFSIGLKCLASDEVYDLGRKFVYKPNPVLNPDQNQKSIISGGIELPFRGENLLSTGFPIMMLFIEYEDQNTQRTEQIGCYDHSNSVMWCKQVCHLRNDTEFVCVSPNLYDVIPEDHGGGFRKGEEGTTGTSWTTTFSTALELEISSIDELTLYMRFLISTENEYNTTDSTRKKRETVIQLQGKEVLDVTAQIGVILDGQRLGVTDTTIKQAFDLTVVKNPEFDVFDVKNFNPEFHEYEETIRITGNYVNSGANERDITVTVGGNPCPLTGPPTLNGFLCSPPSSLTDATGPTKGGGYQAVVTVGHVSWSVGFIKYVRWYQSAVFIGLVVAAILIPLIIVAVYFLVTRCALPLCYPTEYPFVPGSVHSNVYDTDILSKIGSDLSGKVRTSGLLLPTSVKVKIVDRLGSGNFGVVYAGFLQTEGSEYPEYVAIKTLKDGRDLDDEHMKEVFEEALIMKDLDHQNVVKIIGIVLMKNQPHIILPFMKNKDLRSHISNSNNRFTVRDLVEYGIQIASGMTHVSSLGLVHRDLAARNCMVSDDETIKVSDFGLARETNYRNLYSQQSRGGGLPVRWMAIESLLTLTFNSKSDVWSFGVVLWELLTRGGQPYADQKGENLKSFLRRGHRLHKPGVCTSQIYQIMTCCWEHDPEDRPSFSELVSSMTEALNNKPAGYTDPSVAPTYTDIEKQSPSDEYSDPYVVMVPRGGGIDRRRNSIPYELAPKPPGNNGIV